MMRVVVLVFVVCAAMFGQTTFTMDQLRPAPAGVDLSQVQLVASFGNLRVPVVLGEGVELKLIDGKVTIIAPKPVVILPPFVRNVDAARQSDGSYIPAQGPPDGLPSMQVYRGGQRVRPGVDYNLAGNRIVPIVPWPAESQVFVDYEP